MACCCEVNSSFRKWNIAYASLPFVPRECLLLQRGTSSDRHWWDVQDSREDVSRRSGFLVSELDGRLDPTWCRRIKVPSGSGYVLLCDSQRGHMKDFSHRPPIFRRGSKRKRAPGIHSLLAAHTTSQDCRRRSPPKSCSSLEDVSPAVRPGSTNQMESRRDVTKRCDGRPSFRLSATPPVLSCFAVSDCHSSFSVICIAFCLMPVGSRPTSQFALMRCHVCAL